MCIKSSPCGGRLGGFLNTKKGSTRRYCHEHYYFSLNEFSMLCISSLNVLSTFMRCSICEQL